MLPWKTFWIYKQRSAMQNATHYKCLIRKYLSYFLVTVRDKILYRTKQDLDTATDITTLQHFKVLHGILVWTLLMG